MDLTRPLAVVTPTLDGDVLRVLARKQDALTPGELQRLLGAHSVDGIRKALNRLAGQGIVLSRRAGSGNLYRLNRHHLAAGAILELANMRRTFLTRLASELAAWQAPATYAALFGSAARHDMTATSDIDIFLLRPTAVNPELWSDQIISLVTRVTAWTGNDTRILEYSRPEVAAHRREPVLAAVQDEGIPLVGDAEEFRRARRSGDHAE